MGPVRQESDAEMIGDDDNPDYITFEVYEKMVYENNDIVKWLAVDLQRVSQSAKLILQDKAGIKNITSINNPT